jgi:hypothetical protein
MPALNSWLRGNFLEETNFIESISVTLPVPKIARRPISATGNQMKLCGTKNSSNVENIVH